MIDIDHLPREEPGKPLIKVSPDFTDKLMVRIRAERRRYERQRLLRLGVIIASGAVIVALILWVAVRLL